MIQSTIDNNGITETNINNYLREIKSISYYACYPVIHSFLNSSIRRCFFVDNELVVRKHKTNPTYHLCFRENDRITEKVGAQSYLFLPEIRNKKDVVEKEYVYDNSYITELKNKNIRNSYNYALKHYNLSVRDLSDVSVPQLYQFLDEWKEAHKHYFRLTIKRDYTLLDLKSKLFGTVIIDLDTSKVIGYEINTKCIAREGLCINVFRKALTQYKNLDCFVKVEGSRKMLEKGFKYSNDSTATTSGLKAFKERFVGDKGFVNKGFVNKVYYSKV